MKAGLIIPQSIGPGFVHSARWGDNAHRSVDGDSLNMDDRLQDRHIGNFDTRDFYWTSSEPIGSGGNLGSH